MDLLGGLRHTCQQSAGLEWVDERGGSEDRLQFEGLLTVGEGFDPSQLAIGEAGEEEAGDLVVVAGGHRGDPGIGDQRHSVTCVTGP